ncbi:unnamed protein product [Calypogeia fissa]
MPNCRTAKVVFLRMRAAEDRQTVRLVWNGSEDDPQPALRGDGDDRVSFGRLETGDAGEMLEGGVGGRGGGGRRSEMMKRRSSEVGDSVFDRGGMV